MLSSQVKFSADRQTDGRTDRQTDVCKTICPGSIDAGGIKRKLCKDPGKEEKDCYQNFLRVQSLFPLKQQAVMTFTPQPPFV